jgi:hypothetical protein
MQVRTFDMATQRCRTGQKMHIRQAQTHRLAPSNTGCGQHRDEQDISWVPAFGQNHLANIDAGITSASSLTPETVPPSISRQSIDDAVDRWARNRAPARFQIAGKA